MKDKSNNHRLLSILMGNEKFQTYISSVREFLEVPEDGFSNDEIVKKWTYEMDEKDEKYLNSVGYKNQNLNIRKKIKSGEIDIAMANKHLHVLGDNLRVNHLTSACKYVVDKFNLPSHLTNAIKYYILYNKLVFVPTENFAYIPDINKDRVARIEVYSKLTKEEEKRLLVLIKEQTNDFPKIKQISDTTMKRLSFDDWNKNKNSYTEKITAKDIAKEYLGSSKKSQHVYDGKRELEKKRKKLFG